MMKGFIDVSQLMARLWRAVDLRRYDEAAALFTVNGRWERGGIWHEGREAIVGSLNARPENLFTRHILSNFVVDLAADSLVYEHSIVGFADRSPANGKPRLPGPPVGIIDAKGSCTREAGALRIRELAMAVEFLAAP